MMEPGRGASMSKFVVMVGMLLDSVGIMVGIMADVPTALNIKSVEGRSMRFVRIVCVGRDSPPARD